MKLTLALLVLLLLTACSEENNTPVVPEVVYTNISGKISGELISSESPYKVMQDISVDSNSTLRINAGVELHFVENTRLVVKGELIVEGSNNKFVVFKSFDDSKTWNGIKIIDADKQALFNFVKIENINQAVDTSLVSASISIMNSEAEFNHSFIKNNFAIHGGAIGTYNSKLIFKNNIVSNNIAEVWGGAILSELSEIKIINNTFYHNYSGNNCGGILVYDPVKTELQNNIFYKNSCRLGDFNFQYLSTDSTYLIEQFNYLSFGTIDIKFVSDTDFRLSQSSPCIDAGNSDASYNDPDGSRNDQGAYGGPLGNW